MCGFSGFYNPTTTLTLEKEKYHRILTQMTQTLRHRGKDDQGIFLSDHLGVSHTRLAIIDPTHAKQPYYCMDYVLVYNGELYNTKELREKIIETCHTQNISSHVRGALLPFDTTSDTETLLKGLILFGPDFIKELDGIFAFACYNQTKKELLLARDSFGVKPLFYSMISDTFVFSSEIKGIADFPGFEATLSRQGLLDLFAIGPARIPGHGIFDGVYECFPGTYLRITPSTSFDMLVPKEDDTQPNAATTYWKLPSWPHSDDYDKTVKNTRELIVHAVKKQMVSDVPICTFLSGGIDSSLVSSICAANSTDLSTFSFVFSESETYFKKNAFQPALDQPYALFMADYLKSKHQTLTCDAMTQAGLLCASVLSHDLPCMADIDSSLLYFCSQVGKSHKVVLTGECADEVFGGYPWFHKKELQGKGMFPWTPDFTFREQILHPDLRDALSLKEYAKSAYENATRQITHLLDETPFEYYHRELSNINIRFFMQTLLNRMDRTSMYASLEARVPFCDRALVEYIYNVPWEYKAKNGVKGLLKDAAAGLLPEEILTRKKSPYPKDYHPEYLNILKGMLQARLSTSKHLRFLTNLSEVNTILKHPDRALPWYGQLMKTPQMIAYLIQIDFWLEHYKIKLSL